MNIEQNTELGFSFVCPRERTFEVIYGLNKLEIEIPTVFFSPETHEKEVEITGKCNPGQDIVVAQAVFEAGQAAEDVSFIRHTVIKFEHLSQRVLLAPNVVQTVVHQIAIRSLIQGQEDY